MPRHPEVLRLAETAYIRTEAWQALLDIIPSMQKIALHTDDELEQLRQQAYIGLMGQKMSENGCDGLKIGGRHSLVRSNMIMDYDLY